ncbi:aminoglycoside phosphotransferase family protein [Synechocystis sp. LKSZ1]|uniref:phosphotransferase enzyme family protein n=1 Tax=Synechocystis sp. LKSZ1 TaxID=3144951 RepID=UPI00336BC2B5
MIEALSPEVAATIWPIADQFAHQGQITGLKRFGNGNINDTFLVSLDDVAQTYDVAQTCFVLQRINTQVFHNPQGVMSNMVVLTEHIHQKWHEHADNRRWEMPRVILTRQQQDHWDSGTGDYWRAISYIEGSESFDTLQDLDHAREVGYALGTFHHLVSDLDPQRLVDTLPGFHITPQYLTQYQQVLETIPTSRLTSPEVKFCLDFVRERAAWCSVLETAKAQGKLPLRLMHGDPKVNNIMFDCATGKAVSVVDLDTAKPGLIHYDLGDCLRSGCNPLGEDTTDWQQVRFEPDLCRSILAGYCGVAQGFLTPADYDYLVAAIRLIAFELGLRFFSDYLAGNQYFKVKYAEHNLARALVQFQLTASIEGQAESLEKLVQSLRQGRTF